MRYRGRRRASPEIGKPPCSKRRSTRRFEVVCSQRPVTGASRHRRATASGTASRRPVSRRWRGGVACDRDPRLAALGDARPTSPTQERVLELTYLWEAGRRALALPPPDLEEDGSGGGHPSRGAGGAGGRPRTPRRSSPSSTSALRRQSPGECRRKVSLMLCACAATARRPTRKMSSEVDGSRP